MSTTALLLSDRTLAFAPTPCFRIDTAADPLAPHWPGDVVAGRLTLSNKFLGAQGAQGAYHSVEVSLISEAKIRASVQMPQGNVVPSFDKITLWKSSPQQVWPSSSSTPKPDELGLVSLPFAVRLPTTFPALPAPASDAPSKGAPATSTVIQIPPLPSCTLPPGLQVVVYIVAEARRTSTLIKKARKDIVRLPILLHREPKAKLLRWLPPVEDPASRTLRFDPRYWTSSTTIVTLKQTTLDRRRLWVTLTIPNIARSHGAAESERLPFLLEITYQSKRQSARKAGSTTTSASHAPPANMVDQTALPTLPLTTSKRELEPRLFVGQRVACTFEDGSTSDFRQDDLEVEWDAFHLEPNLLVSSTAAAPHNSTHTSGFTPRNRIELQPRAVSSGLEMFQGHGWTLPEWKSINEIKALRRELERGSTSERVRSSDEDVTGIDEGDEEEEGNNNVVARVDEKDKSLSHHTSSALSHIRKALFAPTDPDSVGYWISRAALSGTFRAPAALPSFDFAFGPELKRDAQACAIGFDAGSHSRGIISLSYELGVGWTVPESAQPGPENPRSGHAKRRTIVSYKTFERGLVNWISAATGAVPERAGEDGDGTRTSSSGNGTRTRLSSAPPPAPPSDTRNAAPPPRTLLPPTRADILRSARAKCKAAKLGRSGEPALSSAEAEALEEEAQLERVRTGRWSGRGGGGRSASASSAAADREGMGDGDEEEDEEDDNDDDDEEVRRDEAARRQRERERNALLFNLPPGYFATTAEFEGNVVEEEVGNKPPVDAPTQQPQLEHTHPLKS
ncbi:hypothetical protein OC842_003340 [Tilletia horrida]|uniref:Uncharacterized protein n=1 Tax=Tilletia horrida TaxID=155126 RepID=A0AAN6JKU2_9BASI|nr:hypothetical protein OC842_003340 [Tilletia horrida]